MTLTVCGEHLTPVRDPLSARPRTFFDIYCGEPPALAVEDPSPRLCWTRILLLWVFEMKLLKTLIFHPFYYSVIITFLLDDLVADTGRTSRVGLLVQTVHE